jgi:hypothetical protein
MAPWNRKRRPHRRGPREQDDDVAVLALAAAIAIAVLTGVATWWSSQAGGAWQTALREELKWSAAAVEDIRFVHADQAPDIFRADLADARAQALRREASGSSGLAGEVGRAEARTELELAFRTRQRLGLSPDQLQAYRLPDGGFGLARRLADERNLHPDLVGLDPEPEQADGDRASGEASWAAAAAVPVAAAFVLAALATLARRGSRNRVLLLRCGYLLLGASALLLFEGVLS